jgi:hypothetical protein
MERLTIRTPKGAALKMDDTYQSEDEAKKALMQKYRFAIDRLAAYEDTGLEPGEVQAWKQAEAEGRLMVLETDPRDSYKGLKRKYIVLKSDSGEPVENCFVLRPDKDNAAKIALEAYAKTTGNKTLADDITRWIGDSGKALVLPCKVGDTVYVHEEKINSF